VVAPSGDTSAGFEHQLRIHARRLDEIGVNYRKASLEIK